MRLSIAGGETPPLRLPLRHTRRDTPWGEAVRRIERKTDVHNRMQGFRFPDGRPASPTLPHSPSVAYGASSLPEGALRNVFPSTSTASHTGRTDSRMDVPPPQHFRTLPHRLRRSSLPEGALRNVFPSTSTASHTGRTDSRRCQYKKTPYSSQNTEFFYTFILPQGRNNSSPRRRP